MFGMDLECRFEFYGIEKLEFFSLSLWVRSDGHFLLFFELCGVGVRLSLFVRDGRVP